MASRSFYLRDVFIVYPEVGAEFVGRQSTGEINRALDPVARRSTRRASRSCFGTGISKIEDQCSVRRFRIDAAKIDRAIQDFRRVPVKNVVALRSCPLSWLRGATGCAVVAHYWQTSSQDSGQRQSRTWRQTKRWVRCGGHFSSTLLRERTQDCSCSAFQVETARRTQFKDLAIQSSTAGS